MLLGPLAAATSKRPASSARLMIIIYLIRCSASSTVVYKKNCIRQRITYKRETMGIYILIHNIRAPIRKHTRMYVLPLNESTHEALFSAYSAQCVLTQIFARFRDCPSKLDYLHTVAATDRIAHSLRNTTHEIRRKTGNSATVPLISHWFMIYLCPCMFGWSSGGTAIAAEVRFWSPEDGIYTGISANRLWDVSDKVHVRTKCT